MQLTSEQRAVVDAASDPSHPRLTIIGYAGAAKTTTTLEIGRVLGRMEKKGRTFFFNHDMAVEMEDKIKTEGVKGMTASTLHGLAYRSMKNRFGKRVGERLLARDVADSLGFGWYDPAFIGHKVSPTGAGYIAMSSLRRWCYSSDPLMTREHLRAGDHEQFEYAPQVREFFSQQSFALAEAVMLKSKKDYGLAMDHNIYLKRYVEDVAEKPKTGPRVEYLIGDEFQDSNAPAIKFMETMMGRGVQTMVAGDPYQQIYQWRGSVDAIHRVESDAVFELTHSFRFGQSLADLASATLRYLGGQVNLIGNPERRTAITFDSSDSILTRTGERAVICRTNAGVVGTALSLTNQGFRCYVPKAWKVCSTLSDISALKQRGRATKTDLRAFRNYAEFMEFMEESGDANEYTALLKIVDKFGIGCVKKLMQSCTVELPSAVRVVTAHGAKGLQYDHVALANDFPEMDALMDDGSPDEEEFRLLYVALTRARHSLAIGECPAVIDIHRQC